MLYSATIIFSMGEELIDWLEDFSDEKNFPTSIMFDSDKIRKPEYHMKFVRKNENKDVFGNMGNFIMGDNYSVGIIADQNMGNSIEEVLSKIPHSDKMNIYRVKFEVDKKNYK